MSDKLTIKKVITNIYSFDLSNCTLKSGEEMINTPKGNEFVNTFRKRDLDNGIIVTPGNYLKGLIYKSTNGGEFYNKPEWVPDIVTFSLDIFGLKKGAFYRIIIKGRNTRTYNSLLDSTENRELEITNGNSELIISHDFSNELDNVDVEGFFKAESNEETLLFSLGKIYINDIIIDEVDLLSTEEEEVTEEIISEEIISNYKALGVFSLEPKLQRARYAELDRLTGFGINLYYDQNEKSYILERDNKNDTVKAPFTNITYIIDMNFNKVVSSGIFDKYSIKNVSNEISPNTLKQGYIKFELLKDGKAIQYPNSDARLIISIREI